MDTYVPNSGTIISFTLEVVSYFIWSEWMSPDESWAGGPLNPRVRPRERCGHHKKSRKSSEKWSEAIYGWLIEVKQEDIWMNLDDLKLISSEHQNYGNNHRA